MLDDLFDAFHLSPKERKVISCLLERGMQRASTVAMLCELPRNTTRGILDKLVGSGFLVRSRRRNAHYYSVDNTEALRRTLEMKRDAFTEEVGRQLSALSREGHLLASFSVSATRPKVTFYDGYEGLRRVYEDTLTATEGLRSWGSFDTNRLALPRYFTTYYKRRARRGIPMTSIHPDTPLAREHHKNDSKELRQSVLVSKSSFNLSPEIQVYDNKVNIVSWREKIGIIIESEEIANAIKAIFDLSLKGTGVKRR